MNRTDIETICLDTMRTALNDYETIKAELECLKRGDVVLTPVDKDHAKTMLIIAMHYLGIKPGEPVSLTQ